jgi:hypothetical protein
MDFHKISFWGGLLKFVPFQFWFKLEQNKNKKDTSHEDTRASVCILNMTSYILVFIQVKNVLNKRCRDK